MDRWSVRPASVAGMFYPHDGKNLMKQVVELTERAKPKRIKGNLIALISPHAGYLYSGLTAAHGFKLLKGKSYDTVVIIAPSHHEYFEGVSVYPGNAYRTPLGEVLIDIELRKELLKSTSLIKESSQGHGDEHAVEVQLPFLQIELTNFKLLPIVIGNQTKDVIYKVGEVIGSVLRNKKALIVASTDLSHYHPYDVAIKLDKIAIDHIAKFDYENLLSDLNDQNTEACGGGAAAAALIAANILGANKVELLHSCNSGDITGDKGGVVGYMSAAVIKSEK